MELQLLGEVAAHGGRVDLGPARQRCVFAALAVDVNRVVPVDGLIERVWGANPPLRARATLLTYLSRLRQALARTGTMRLDRRSGGYLLTAEESAVDLCRFRELCAQARDAGDVEAVRLLTEALALWRGEPLTGVAGAWAEAERDRLGRARLAAEHDLVDARLRTGEGEELVLELSTRFVDHPLDERMAAQLMLALYRGGRQADALATYQRMRERLAEELGVDPGPELRAMHLHVLSTDSAGCEPPDHAGQVLRQLPHDITRFTGRETELAALDGLLTEAGATSAPTIVAICGAAGVGKTTLAVHWAKRAAHRYPDTQLYLNLYGYGPGDPLQPETAAETLLRALGVRSQLIPAELDDRSSLLRSRFSERVPLLLLDNARDAEQVRPLLPGGPGLVIVTSRSQLRGLSALDGAHRLTLSPLTWEQAIELLAATLGDSWVRAEPTAATALVELCDRLPLALAIVAERAHRAGSLVRVVTELTDEQARLDALETWEDGPSSSLRAALSWSYRALNDEAAALFRKLGLHPTNDFELRAAAALADVPVSRVRALLDQLVSAHLVEQHRADRYQLHDLVRLYALELTRPESQVDRDATVRRALGWYLHTAVSADTALLPHRPRSYVAPLEPDQPPPQFSADTAATWFAEEYECLRCAIGWAARHGFAEHAWRIACSMITFLHRAIPYNDSIELLTSVLKPAEAAGELAGTAHLHYSLGGLQYLAGNLDAAISHNENALAGFHAVADQVSETTAMGTLAVYLADRGDIDACRHYASEALHRCEQAATPGGIAFHLSVRAIAHILAGEYRQAVDRCTQAIAILEGQPDEHVAILCGYHLARAYAHLREFPNAVRTFRRVITFVRVIGNRHFEAVFLADLGSTLADAGHPAIARSIWRTALVTLTEFGDPRAQNVRAALTAL